MKRFLLRHAVTLAPLMALLAIGVSAPAQNVFVTANTLLTADIPGSLYIGIDNFPLRQTRNTNPAVEITSIGVGGSVLTFNTSTFDVAGGNIAGGLQTHNSSVINISGGTVNGLLTSTASTVNISGGTVNGVITFETSTVNIRGGNVESGVVTSETSTVNIFGGHINADLNVSDSGTINLFGTDLKSVLTDAHAPGNASKYTLSGHLLDGADITGKQVFVANGTNATVTINNSPFNLFLTADALLRTTVPNDVYVGVNDVPGQQTLNTSPVLRLVEGSNVSSSLFVFNSSVVSLEGGRVNGVLDALNSSIVNVSGGYARLLVAGSSSTVNLSGGYAVSALAAISSTFNVNGGIIGMGMTAQQNSTVNIRGGSFGFIPIGSGTFGGITALGNSRINLFGTDLSNVLSDPLFFGLYSQYILSGHLIDGTDVTGLNINISNNSSAAFTLNNVPVAAASGTIALAGLSASAAPQQAELTFRPTDGSPSFTRMVTLNANSSFTMTGIPRAHYILHSKVVKYLAANLNLDLSNGDVSGITLTLRAGDADNNNVVDIADLIILINAYNSSVNIPGSRYDARADFNGDGADDIADLLLLIANYNKRGDA